MLCTVDGLVLRARDYGENDRLITILTADGKMTVIAKGARSLKSKIKNRTNFLYFGQSPDYCPLNTAEVKAFGYTDKAVV